VRLRRCGAARAVGLANVTIPFALTRIMPVALAGIPQIGLIFVCKGIPMTLSYKHFTSTDSRSRKGAQTMASSESTTHWIRQLKEGERTAVQKLWESYFTRLVRMARRWLRNTPTQALDAEDIALSAFDSFRLRAEQGRFPNAYCR
jgi:hypothetical protein